jgi:hypothetical protein
MGDRKPAEKPQNRPEPGDKDEAPPPGKPTPVVYTEEDDPIYSEIFDPTPDVSEASRTSSKRRRVSKYPYFPTWDKEEVPDLPRPSAAAKYGGTGP